MGKKILTILRRFFLFIKNCVQCTSNLVSYTPDKEILPCDAKSYLTHAILFRASNNVIM